MQHTAAEHIRLLIPYIGRTCRYEDCEKGAWEYIMSLDLILQMGDYILLPYLKPLTASVYGDMAKSLHFAWEETKHIPYNEIQVCVKWAKALDVLRWQGYDCDRLIEQGLALLDPAYDIKDLL